MLDLGSLTELGASTFHDKVVVKSERQKFTCYVEIESGLCIYNTYTILGLFVNKIG